MSFLNPFFFIGSLALAVPILIHLVRRDQSEIVRFSSLMFLLRIPRKTIRQQKLRNLLLMALRLLLLALLVGAFARPYLVESNAAIIPDSQSRGVVLLLDNSYSMTYGTSFERMKSEARDRIDAMAPGDRVAIIAFNESATLQTMPSDDPVELKTLIAALEPSSDRTSFYEAFTLADRVFGQLEGYDQELVVISDFQRNGWNRSSRESVIDADVRTEIVDLGIDNPENVGIDSVGVDAAVFTRTYTGQVMARINNHHLADPVTVPVSISINDREVGRRTVVIPADSSMLVEFSGFDLPLGYSRGAVRVDAEDPLMVDNEFLFVVQRREKLRMLIVDAGRPQQSFFLQQALTSAPDLPFDVTTTRVNNLNPDQLENYEVVILNDVPRLSAPIKTRLDEMRAGGQGQLVFLGDNIDLDWWNGFEALPVRLSDKVFVERDRDQAFYSLTSYDRNHEIFVPLEQTTRLTLNTARFFAYLEMEPKDDAVVIAKLENGSPMIAELSGEDRGLLVFGSSMDNVWNDFPLKPSFLPVVHEMVRYLARYRESDAWHQLGEAVPVLTGADEGVALITPDGERLNMGDASGAGQRFFTPDLVGFYEVRIGPETEHIAVNPPSSESLLAPIPPDELMSSVQRLEGEVRRGALLAESDEGDFARRQSWWWYLFLFALLVGIGEIYLGNHVTAAMSDQAPVRSPSISG
jgi:hypothetical protein